MRILLLEDSDIDAGLVAEQLREIVPDATIHRAACRDDYMAALEREPDLIVADYALPDFDGLTALDLAGSLAPATPFILVSGVVGEEFAIEALKRGASDYVLKQRLGRLPMVVARALKEAQDRRERQRAQAQLQLLIAELNHRVNNTLAVVQSLARSSLRGAASLKEFETKFLARLQSLAKTQRLLSETDWAGVALRDMLQAELSPYASPRGPSVALLGPDLRLPAASAMHLALLVHELATNAAKYGAFSVPHGELWVRWGWRAGATGRLWIEWRERQGQRPRAANRPGFGSRLIQRTVAALGGQFEKEYTDDGLRYGVEVTLTGFETGAEILGEGRPEGALRP